MEDKITYIDLENGLNRVRGNRKLYFDMLKLFLQAKEIGLMEESLQARDMERAASVAHAIKGMTGNLSFSALFAATNDLLESLRANAWDEVLIARYRQALEKTLEHLREMIREAGPR